LIITEETYISILGCFADSKALTSQDSQFPMSRGKGRLLLWII